MWYSCDCCVTPTAVKIYPKRKLDSIWRKTNPFLMNELVILVVVWLSCDHFCLLYEELFIVGHNNGYMYIEQWSVASWMVRSTATIALCTHCFRSEKKHNKRNLPLVWNEGNLCFYSLSLCRGDGLSTLVVLKATLSSFSSISPVLPLELIPVLIHSVPHFPWQPDPGLPTGLEMNHHHFQLPQHSVSFTPPSQEFNTTFPC